MPSQRVPINLAVALHIAQRNLRAVEHRVEVSGITRAIGVELHTAERNVRNAELRVQAVFNQLFESWRGWKFKPPAELEVYMANYTAGAAAMLHANGFVTVTLHGHQAERFLSCKCRVSEIPK